MAKFPVDIVKSKDVPSNKDYLLKWGGTIWILVAVHQKLADSLGWISEILHELT